jgi:hypothetical protein
VEDTQIATPAVQTGDTSQPAEPATSSSEPATEDSSPFSTWRRGNGSWGATSDTAETTTSPADRFEAALDAEGAAETPSENTSAEQSRQESGSTEDRFASWAAAYASSGNTTSDDEVVESATIAPAESGIAAADPGLSATDAAGFSGGAAREVDYLSGDESSAMDGPGFGIATSTPADQTDVRERATTLVDELRGLIWKIGEAESNGEGDTRDALHGLTAARGKAADFSDLESVIAAVRESPKDVDALRELGKQAQRLESLLDSHASLIGAVDDAIRKLR